MHKGMKTQYFKNMNAKSFNVDVWRADCFCHPEQAKKRCPSLVVMDGEDLTRYREASEAIFR